MSRLSELIEALPADLQQIAERFLTMTDSFLEEEFEAWIDLIIAGDWDSAYRFAIQNLTTDELVIETGRLNAVLADLNKANAELADAQKKTVRDLLLAIVGLGLREIREG